MTATEPELEIIAIGNELLLGETVDTNSAWIARRLAGVGVRVGRVTTVGDDRERIRGAIEAARGRARWAITMGGLGPTRDDLTREVVAEALGRPLEIDPEQLAIVEEKFRRFGYTEMPESNRSQAAVPRGATVFPNPGGTAPGLGLDEDGFTLFVLPGVPGEMKALVEDAVVPALLADIGEGTRVVRSRTVHTVGIGESSLAERLDDVVDDAGPVQVAFLPHTGQVDVRLTVAGLGAEEAARRLDGVVERIAERAARWCWGVDDVTLPGAVNEALRSRGWTVAVAESCTAGELGAAITSEAGSSDVFLGGVMAYADRVKEDLLGVDGGALAAHGAVSEATCRAMARGVRDRFDAAVGCAITGIAGPGGGTDEKPVGLVFVGIETPEGAEVVRLDVPGSRAAVRRRSTLHALALLLRHARGGPG